jgi:hypothetical protein
MSSKGRFLFWLLATIMVLAVGVAVAGAQGIDIYNCPDNFPEGPAFTQHIEQADIVDGALNLEEVLAVGQALFDADFNTCDGRGRPATTGGGDKRDPAGQPAFLRTSSPDSNSCDGCHNEPRSGGGGDFVANVFVLAQTLDPVVESVNGEFSNERNTLGMFGAGPIEMLAREMTAELWATRDETIARAAAENVDVRLPLETKGISFGSIMAGPDGELDTSQVQGVDYDLIVRPFHQAGRVVSLREFTDNAMNHHHGMQAEERFDLDPAKGPDFDEDGVARELTVGDMTAITLFQAALATPGRLLPDDAQDQAQVDLGQTLFGAIGCASCHAPALTLDSAWFIEPNPYNPPGTWTDTSLSVSFDMTRAGLGQRLEATPGGGALVRAYTDLKRHNLCDPPAAPDAIRFLCNEQLDQGRHGEDDRPGTEYFLTRKLWDVGNSQPYGHRGDLTTLTEAILVHGGEGRAARDAFLALPVQDQAAIISFLKCLQVLPESDERVMTESEAASLLAGPAGNGDRLVGSASGRASPLAWALIPLVGCVAMLGWFAALLATIGLLVSRRPARRTTTGPA